MKRCSKCKEEKPFDEFYKDKRNLDGKTNECKDCVKIKNKKSYLKNRDKKLEAGRKWREENKHIRQQYYKNNKEKIQLKNKRWYEKNKEYANKKGKEWREANKGYQTKYCRERYAHDPLFRLTIAVRKFCSRVTDAVKQDKELRSLEYLGCSLEEFKSHIESLWLDGMSWENHGDWHIDHKVPLDWYVKNSDDPWEANHYTNLQPLWAAENLSKGSSI